MKPLLHAIAVALHCFILTAVKTLLDRQLRTIQKLRMSFTFLKGCNTRAHTLPYMSGEQYTETKSEHEA